jgi:hypothetical protein
MGRLNAKNPRPHSNFNTGGNRQLFGWEQRDDFVALVSDDEFLLDTRPGETIACGTIGLEREHHAFLNHGRMIKGYHPADDRAFMQIEAEAVSELQPKRRQLVREPEFFPSFAGFSTPSAEFLLCKVANNVTVLARRQLPSESATFTIFFKIDYYDRTLTHHSSDPADPTVTSRIITVMLAEEY